MPMNHGQSQQSTRWYKLCFIPTIGDSSDDSDTESVIIAPSTPTPHPAPSPPSPELEINWLCPPPPPPPLPFFTPSRLSVRSVPPLQFHTANSEPQINQRSSQPSLLPSQPSNPEPQINWSFPPPPPPPFFPPSPTLLPLEFPASNPEPRVNLQYSQPLPPPPLPPQDPWNHFINTFPSLTTQGQSDDDQSEFLRIPDNVIDAIHMVRISKLHLKDDLSHCPICMEEFKLGDQACQLPCNHIFKFECILCWLNTSKTCPVCRLQLDGFVGQGSSYDIGDDEESLDLEPQIPLQVTNSLQNLFQSSVDSQVTEDDAGENSDEAEYDSACDELGWY